MTGNIITGNIITAGNISICCWQYYNYFSWVNDEIVIQIINKMDRINVYSKAI